MEGKTYLEILAEQDGEQKFDPNAKDLLVQNVHEYEHSVDGEDHHPDELEDQDAFQKPQGSHQQASHVPITDKHEDKTKLSVRYDKDVFTQLINIDSRFRTDPLQSSTNFLYKLKRPIKNVISVRMSSIEIPNTSYTFSLYRGNTSMSFVYPAGSGTKYTITIPDGNYSPLDILPIISQKLNTCISGVVFNVSTSISTGKTTITSTQFVDFIFNVGAFSSRLTTFGLGSNLGFRNPNYLATKSITSEGIINTADDNYVFLSLDPDWKVVIHETTDKTQLFSFAKIIMDVPKFSVLFDNGANTLTKEYWLKQPTNIVSIPIRLSDAFDQDLDLTGMDFSFSLEVKEVLNAALYETMRS